MLTTLPATHHHHLHQFKSVLPFAAVIHFVLKFKNHPSLARASLQNHYLQSSSPSIQKEPNSNHKPITVLCPVSIIHQFAATNSSTHHFNSSSPP
jgi:hypothetical protein